MPSPGASNSRRMACSRVAFPVSLGQAQEVEEVRVAEDEVRRQAVLVPQRGKLHADDLLRLLADRRAFVDHPLDLVLEGPGAPPLRTAHLGVELAFQRIFDGNRQLPKVRPRQLCTQCVHYLLVGECLGESDNMKPVRCDQTPGRIRRSIVHSSAFNNLLAIGRSFLPQNLLADAFADVPVERDQARVDRLHHLLPGRLDHGPHVGQKSVSDLARPTGRPGWIFRWTSLCVASSCSFLCVPPRPLRFIFPAFRVSAEHRVSGQKSGRG